MNTAEPSACTRCGSLSTHWMPKLGNTGGFAAFYHPHLSAEPVFIGSARDMDKAMDKHKVFLHESPKKETYTRLPQTEAEARNV